MAKKYTFNPAPKENAPQNSSEESKGGARILNVFEPTIVLDELSIPEDYASLNSESKRETNKAENLVSSKYPLVKINDYFFGENEIDSLTINSNNRIPTISLTVTFSNELFLTKNMPKDGDIISIMIQSKSDVLKPVRNDYVIKSVIANKRSTLSKKYQTFTIFGELFIPGWTSYIGNSSYRGTTMKVLKTIAKEMGLGFNTNEEDTDDYQAWINFNVMAEFINDICKRSWKEENAFFDWWVDIYYNLNFVNVQKQLLASEQKVDGAAIIGNTEYEYWWGDTNNETRETAKVFSNYIGFRTSSFYIVNWRPINKSSDITFNYGASLDCTFFEHNNILFEDPEVKKYWELEIAPKYDQEKINTHILLRGRTTYDPSTNSGELARANYNYNELYKRSPWLGIQYTLSNPEEDPSQWTGNQHRNYMRAKVNNIINLVELDKLNIEIQVQGTNLNIIRGDKVPVALIKKDQTEGVLTDHNFEQSEMLDLFYSGWYYVKGFTLSWVFDRRKSSGINNFTQSYTLTRREWPPPVPSTPRENNENE